MKFSQFSNKVAVGLGFSSLHSMDRSDADMDLCWGNGFDNERVSQLFNEIVHGDVVDRDADQLVYYFCQTTEGAKKLVEQAKTFCGAQKVANSLIRGLDYRLGNAGNDRDATSKIDKFVNTLRALTEGEEIPFVSFEKPSYITDIRFWEIITRSNPDISTILRTLTAGELSAARYFIESKTGSFIDQVSMEKWKFPGYIHTAMQIPEQVEVYRFLASHIGERQAFIKIVDPNTFGDSVAPFIKQLAKSADFSHWKNTFLIQDCVEFLSGSSNKAIPTFIQDLLACSISMDKPDLEQISGLKKSAVSRLVSRGCVSDKTAMLMAGKNSRLKGKILEDSLGM